MAKTPYIFRTLHAKDRKVLAEYTHMAGLIVWASNALHSKFLLIFEEILLFEFNGHRLTQRKLARAMWHSLRSDDAQRALLLAATKAALDTDRPLIKSLVWAINSAGRLAEFRNDVVHTPFAFIPDERRWKMMPNIDAGPPRRVEKLERVGYSKLFKLLLGDLIQMRVYTETILVNLSSNKKYSMPHRPRLKSALLVQRSPPRTNGHQSIGTKSLPLQFGVRTWKELRQLVGAETVRSIRSSLP